MEKGKVQTSAGMTREAHLLIFSLLTNYVQKNIVEKCGKALTYPQKTYLCSQFWHENRHNRTSRHLFDAEYIYHIRLQWSRKNHRLADGVAGDFAMQGVRQLRRNRQRPLPAQSRRCQGSIPPHTTNMDFSLYLAASLIHLWFLWEAKVPTVK